MTPSQEEAMTGMIDKDHNVQDITPDDVSTWVMDEFCALQDVLEVAARIDEERAVIAENAHRSHIFPMTHFAHEALLIELEQQLARMMDEIVTSPRTLN